MRHLQTQPAYHDIFETAEYANINLIFLVA